MKHQSIWQQYTCSERNQENNPFTTASKMKKYPGINIIKEKNDLYNSNYEPLKIETEEGTSRWRGIPFPWISRTRIVKLLKLVKAIDRFNITTLKIPKSFSTEIEKHS
jgi:hypothetical protein